MRRVIALVAGVLVVASLVGCGGGGGHATPKAAFEAMVAAAKAGNKDAMMACFDKETREAIAELDTMAGSEAAKTEGLKGKASDEFASMFKTTKVEYGEAKIDGDKATMDVTVGGKKEPTAFVKESGGWKISIPEMKAAAALMKGMKGMGEAMMKGMGEAMEKAVEGTKK
jgi:hypothetical protein